jgi:hypothetical protein
MSSQLEEDKREEVRGIFTIGILAILIVFRTQGNKLTFTYLDKPYDLTFLVDITIMF